MNKKGFVLLETAIVLIVTVIAMLGLYATYSFVFKNLKQAQKYDNMNDVYKLNIFYNLKNQTSLDSISNNFVVINSSNCTTYFDDSNCSSLMSELEFNYFIYTKVGMDSVLAGGVTGLSNSDVNYMKTLEFNYKFLIGVSCSNNDCSGNNNHYVNLKVGGTNGESGSSNLGYTITWKNWDGTVLETDTQVLYGTTPSYDGPTPTKASIGSQAFIFNGWSPEISPVNGNVEYIATYSSATYTCSTGVTPSISNGTCTCTDTHEVEQTEYYAATPGTWNGYCYCSATSSGTGTGQGAQWQGGCGAESCSATCPPEAPYVMPGSTTTCTRNYSCDRPNSWGPDSSHYCGRHYYVNQEYTYDCTVTGN